MSWGAKRRSQIDQFGVSAAATAYRLRSPHCPVTGGRATRMTVETYRKMCLARRAPDNWACVQCHGGQSPPAELELVAADQLNQSTIKENDMSMYGECEICGEKKKVRSVRNKNSCATCEHIWRASNVQPDLVLKTLASAKGDDYLRRAVGVMPPPEPAGTSDTIAVLARIRTTHQLEPEADIEAFVTNLAEELEAANSTVVDVREDRINVQRRLRAAEQVIADIRIILGIENDADTSALEAIQRMKIDMKTVLESYKAQSREIEGIRALRDEWNDMINRLGNIRTALNADPDDDLVVLAGDVNHDADLFGQIVEALGIDADDIEQAPQLVAGILVREQQLLQKVSDLEKIVDNESLPAVLDWTTDRSSALLDLALDVIAGRVSGLDAERIAALR